jgi:hypothetical protein
LPFKFYCSYTTFDLNSFSKVQKQELLQEHDRLVNL